MKCIKAIKATKYSAVGDIKRVKEDEANEKVDTGYWKFIPKSEWKEATRKQEEVREAYPANVEGSPEFNEANRKNRKKSK